MHPLGIIPWRWCYGKTTLSILIFVTLQPFNLACIVYNIKSVKCLLSETFHYAKELKNDLKLLLGVSSCLVNYKVLLPPPYYLILNMYGVSPGNIVLLQQNIQITSWVRKDVFGTSNLYVLVPLMQNFLK